MEEQRNRTTFINNLREFLKPIVLNEIFMRELEKHSNSEYVEQVREFENEMARKTFIFLEFTRERSTCDEMVEILRKSGQEEAAEQLKGFNTSPPFMDITYDIELKITPATVLRSGGSKMFVMDKNPRGMCIIINNVKNELHKESLRFRNIFEQLYFDVAEYYDMSAKAMEDRLKELSKGERLKKDNALVVMIISYGHDEKVIGFDGEDLRISTIVDIFSEINCENMKRKPKVFFFNCCRIQSPEIKSLDIAVVKSCMNYRNTNDKIVIGSETIGQKWINKNNSTLICFTCAEAERSWFGPNEFTFFGQALSHCIAQYACDKSVQQIMSLTFERVKQMQICTEEMHSVHASFPETTFYIMIRDIYLNPGLPDSNKLTN